MAQEADELVVAVTGHIYRAPVGSPLPDDIGDALSGAWIDLGYSTPEGVAFEFGKDTKDIFGWPAHDPLRTLILNEPKMVTFALMQWNNDSFDLAVGGGEWSWTDTGVEFEPHDVGFVNEVAFAVEFTDDDKDYRWLFPRALNKNPFSFTAVADDSSNFPIQMSILQPDDGAKSYKLQTNDVSFAATGS